jgi:guanine deaminase
MYNCQDARWRVLTTCRQSPDGYSETTSDSLADTEAFIKWVQQLHDDKIHAVVTPRFVPTCTPELLQGLGKLAAHFDTPIQSHISESFDEVLLTVSVLS